MERLRDIVQNEQYKVNMIDKTNVVLLHHLDSKPNFILRSSNTHYSTKQRGTTNSFCAIRIHTRYLLQ